MRPIWIKIIVFFCAYLLSVSGLARLGSVFTPISIEKQIQYSQVIVYGEFINKVYRKLRTGEIVTLSKFRPIKFYSSDGNSLKTHNGELDVYYPGGMWQGVAYQVPGSPSFFRGEQVLLFLNVKNNFYWLNNLSLGKYLINDENGKKYLISSVFPNDPSMGKITLSKFEKVILRQTGRNLKWYKRPSRLRNYSIIKQKTYGSSTSRGRDAASVISTSGSNSFGPGASPSSSPGAVTIVAEPEIGGNVHMSASAKGREIQSVSGTPANDESHGPIWPAIILAFLGGLFTVIVRGRS